MQSSLPSGLTQPPFVPPASRGQVFLAPAAARCVAGLLDAVVEGRRVVGLLGGSGVGKTVLLGVAVEELRGWDIDVIRAAAPLPGPHGFQRMIGDAAGVHGADTMEPAMLARAVAATGRTAPLVLAVDDAHTLGQASLHYLWLLASLLGFGPVKLQLVLVGRAGLETALLAPELAPLRQAVGAVRSVPPLDDAETVAYLDHKLRFAGSTLGAVMSDAAVAALQRQAAGVPGEIDLLASRALAADVSSGRRPSSKAAALAVRGDLAAQRGRATGARRKLAGGAGGLAAAGLAVALLLSYRPALMAPTPPQPVAAQAAPASVAAQAAPAAVEAQAASSSVAAPAAPMPVAVQATVTPESEPPTLAPAPAMAPAAASVAPPADEATSLPASGTAAPAFPETILEPLRASEPAPAPPAADPVPTARDVLIEQRARTPAEARPPAFEAPALPAGKGLVLLAKAGDTVPVLYRRVYRGLTPPPYAEVAAANPSVPHPGDLLVFPAPPNGWRN